MEAAHDSEIWKHATVESRIVVSKDEDFFHLANRPDDRGRLLWVRIGNGRTAALLARFESGWGAIEHEFARGQRMVELR
jgi:predicted nuclease of predicted toxin-antitoxin system